MLSVVLLSVAGLAVHAQPRDTVRIDVDRGSRVWIEGGSNVHDWSCRASAFDARVELQAVETEQDGATGIRKVTVSLSARDLKCGNRRMESDLYAALKANDPAQPSYIVATFEASPGERAGVIETQGTLLVAGVERAIATRISTERLANGSIKASGSVPLLMTDFGVKPPVGLFGLIRSKNEVTVKFALVVATRPTP